MHETEMVKKIWIEELVKTRKEKGYTQEKFAELLDLNREHIAKIEIGKRNLSLDKFISALIILGIIQIKKKKFNNNFLYASLKIYLQIVCFFEDKHQKTQRHKEFFYIQANKTS